MMYLNKFSNKQKSKLLRNVTKNYTLDSKLVKNILEELPKRGGKFLVTNHFFMFRFKKNHLTVNNGVFKSNDVSQFFMDHSIPENNYFIRVR